MTYDELYALLPSILLGLFCGLAAYYRGFMDDLDHKPSFRRAVGNMLTSGIMSFIIFSLLNDLTNFEFMTKLSISALVAFVGIDKAFDIVERFFNTFRGGKNGS